jgi:hypothetical protein
MKPVVYLELRIYLSELRKIRNGLMVYILIYEKKPEVSWDCYLQIEKVKKIFTFIGPVM